MLYMTSLLSCPVSRPAQNGHCFHHFYNAHSVLWFFNNSYIFSSTLNLSTCHLKKNMTMPEWHNKFKTYTEVCMVVLLYHDNEKALFRGNRYTPAEASKSRRYFSVKGSLLSGKWANELWLMICSSPFNAICWCFAPSFVKSVSWNRLNHAFCS